MQVRQHQITAPYGRFGSGAESLSPSKSGLHYPR